MYTVDKYRSTFFQTTSSTYRDCRNAKTTKMKIVAAPVKPKGVLLTYKKSSIASGVLSLQLQSGDVAPLRG